MRLTSFTVQGFKTFSQRTVLEFDAGITVVVGPNGSGKSNLADAFRWVLGEQSLRALRSRRTEEVLFSGSRGRPAAGFAEVSLTFDLGATPNRFPLDLACAELSITRRAYRSGENEYYVNRDRVRQRDLLDLLGRAGLGLDGFALVGQGMVDAALSLRPEDRRGLVEQAAAIGHLHARLDDCQDRLTQTRENLSRVADLIAEITPRLRSLERQARQAREREALQQEYLRDLGRWYANELVGPREKLAAATRVVSETRAALQEIDDALTPCVSALDELARSLRERVAGRERAAQELAALRSEEEERRHALVADRERLAGLTRQQAELRRAAQRWEAELVEAEATRRELTARAGELERQIAALQSDLEANERFLAERAQRQRELDRQLRAAETRWQRAEARLASALAQQQAHQERLVHATRALAEGQERRQRVAMEQAELQRRAQEAEGPVAAARQALAAATERRRRAEECLDRAQRRASEAARHLSDLEREIATWRARVDALRAIEENGEGYFPGVRAVLLAARGRTGPRLAGVVGVVARLLEVPPDLERAVETALGSHSQDVVVERWVDAEAAIALLKQTRAGRATFLPLDTLRPSRPTSAPTGPGILGVAANLVSVDPRYRLVSDFLLGHTLLVDDLATARQVLGQCSAAWQIVTREGEVARPTGTVTGGFGGPISRGSLIRQRERREAERALAERLDEWRVRSDAAAAARDEVARAGETVAELRGAERAAEVRLSEVAQVAADQQRHLERITQHLAALQDEIDRLTGARDDLHQAVDGDERAVTAAQLELAEARRHLEAAREAQLAFEQESSEQAALALARRAEHQALQSQMLALRADCSRAEGRRHAVGEQVARQKSLVAEVEQEATDLATRLQGQEAHLRAVRTRAQEAVERLNTLERDCAAAAERQATLQAQRDQRDASRRLALARLQEAERQAERAEAEIASLRRQIDLELGPLDEGALAEGRLCVTALAGLRLDLPIEPLPEARRLRERLDALRGRLRLLPTNGEVIAEYEATRERLDFLQGQHRDLSDTAERLGATIAETRAAMKTRFDAALAEVSARFVARFADLFGGGSARLVVEAADELTGVDIVAQPPGKRSQNLATLSGGERALTAVALLFALIETHPPPFCLLDEVDAALDESNVARFSGALRELSAQTQFIVITHNRRTMEAASAIYGLTLENHCESRVLSLRLP